MYPPLTGGIFVAKTDGGIFVKCLQECKMSFCHFSNVVLSQVFSVILEIK